MNTPKHRLIALCVAVALSMSACAQDPVVYGAEQYGTPPPAAFAAQPSEQVLQLVAPIALYPDELVAQVLAASTYPSEIVQASNWVSANPSLKGAQLAAAVDSQPWDPSVKALTPFPSLLDNAARNLAWTSALGAAYTSDAGQVMNAVQVLRQRAQAAGTLRSTSQQTVSNQGGTIVIEPANPAVVYVPAYNPWAAYGPPLVAYPDWVAVPDIYYPGPGLYFGLGLGIGLFGGFAWGWHHWGSDWHHHEVMHDHAPWRSHSPTFAHLGHPGPGFHGEPHGFEPAHAGAFGGFDHGGIAHGYAGRGHASLGGGFHGGGMAHGGGGFHGGGGHGGGGHR
ncbi:MAG TPA: DUF3300 domain-containing protein [Burkholderiales bacterium]